MFSPKQTLFLASQKWKQIGDTPKSKFDPMLKMEITFSA
jgi:hypothetical protein